MAKFQITLAVVLVSALTSMQCVNADDSEVIAKVQSAWARRHAAITTLHLEFESLCVSAVPRRERSGKRMESGDNRPRPHHERSVVRILGSNVAIDVHRDPDEVPWLPAKDRSVHTADGSQRISTKRMSHSFDSTSGGSVDRRKGNYDYGLYAIYYPVFLVYHGGIDSSYEFDLDNVTVLPGEHAIGETNCVVLRLEYDSGDSLRAIELWLDPQREFVPLRIQKRRDERPSVAYECKYSPHQSAGFVLDSWQMTATSQAGKLSRSETATVREFHVNEDISPKHFCIDFPEGARVRIEASGKTVTVAAGGVIPGFTPNYSSEK
jgi:hypothetical protein